MRSSISWRTRLSQALFNGTVTLDNHESGVAAPRDSVDLVLSSIERALEDQRAQFASLDAKASFILTSGTVLAGFALETLVSGDWALAGAPMMVGYIALVICVFKSYGLRTLAYAPNPEGLREYVAEDFQFTARRMIAAMTAAYARNAEVASSKGSWIRRSQRLLVLSSLYLGLVTVVHAAVS